MTATLTETGAPAEGHGGNGEPRPTETAPGEQGLADAEQNASTALGRYKFVLFGYWCGVWVHLKRIDGARRADPWTALVRHVREQQAQATGKPR